MMKVGCMAICLRSIQFADGSWHWKGHKYKVTKETLSYFIVNKGDYNVA